MSGENILPEVKLTDSQKVRDLEKMTKWLKKKRNVHNSCKGGQLLNHPRRVTFPLQASVPGKI